MAKPDWGELQQRFLSDHAATGVSPKDWCEAQGLNYATARRYIKKPTAQKPAQKKLRTAQKEKCAYNTILADQFKQAFRALANEMDADLAALYFASSRAVGTAGTAPFGIAGDLSDAANARQVLSDNGSPTTDLQMVLGSSAIANLRGKQSVLFKVNESGTDALLREGIVGRLEGFNIHESAHVKKRAASPAAGYLVNGAKAEGDILIAIDTGTGAFAAGDIVTFDGDSNKYLVAAATATAITLAAPGLRQALADNTAITAGGAYTANMAFDRNAFLLASRTPAMPQGGDTADDVMNVTDPVTTRFPVWWRR